MAMEDANSNTDFLPNLTMDTAPVQRAPLNPVAQPTPIRYSPPALAHDNSLESLAQGLKSFDAGLSDYMDQKQAKQNQADTLQAQQDFLKNHQQNYADAVASGAIPPSASPIYVQTWKEEQGKLAGQQLEQKFQQAYEAWPGKSNVGDPTAYSQFAQDWISKNVGTSDPYILKGLLPVIHDFMDHGLKQNIAHQDEVVRQGFADTVSANTNYDISKGIAYANSAGVPLDPNYVAQSVDRSIQQAVSVGIAPDEAQKRAVIAITTSALLNKDGHGAEILKALDVPLPDSKVTLADTPYGSEEKLKAVDSIERYQREQVLHISEQQKAANKAALGVAVTNVMELYAKDPHAVIPEDLLKEGQKYDPTFRFRVAQWQDGFLKNQGASDPTTMRQVELDIMAGKGADSIALAVEKGAITKISDVNDLLHMQKDHDAADPLLSKLKTDTSFEQIMKTIQLQTTDKGTTDPMAALGITNGGLGLEWEVNKRMEEWAAANPNATLQDARTQLGKTWMDLQHLITKPASSLTGAGPVNLPAGNPYATPAPAAPGAPQAAPQVTPTPAPSTTGATPSPSSPSPAGANTTTGSSAGAPGQPLTDPKMVAAAHDWLRTLTPTQQSTLQTQAAARGMTQDQLLMDTYGKLVAAGKVPGQPSPAPASGSPTGGTAGAAFNAREADTFSSAISHWMSTDPNAPATIHQLMGTLQGLHATLPYRGSTTLAAIKDNPQAAHILDFVAGPESTGNYNAYYGHADNTKTDLTNMTLKEVLQFQHNLVSVDGLPSSAAGRYQFMPKTLQGLITQMGLTGNERFTPEVQDNLALQLLKNRGFEQWQQGKLSDTGFMNNLSQEWASLPTPTTGRSYYDKDGLNRSLVTVGQVSKTLADAKGMPAAAAAAAPGAPPAPAKVGSMPVPPSDAAALGRTADKGHYDINNNWVPNEPEAPAPAAQSNTNQKAFVVGDSVGDGVRSALGAVGDTKVSRQPTQTDAAKGAGLGVLETINKLPDGSLKGKPTVILSTGLSNNSGANVEQVVAEQVKGLVAKGASPAAIRILGVGERSDYVANKLNERLMALAAKVGAQFVPLPAGVQVHPDTKGYEELAKRATSQVVRTADAEPSTDEE